MIEIYRKNMKIESGKEYKFAGERLDKEYTSQTRRAGDYLDVGFL